MKWTGYPYNWNLKNMK